MGLSTNEVKLLIFTLQKQNKDTIISLKVIELSAARLSLKIEPSLIKLGYTWRPKAL